MGLLDAGESSKSFSGIVQSSQPRSEFTALSDSSRSGSTPSHPGGAGQRWQSNKAQVSSNLEADSDVVPELVTHKR